MVLLSGCSSTEKSQPTVAAPSPVIAQVESPSPSPQIDPFQEATDIAIGASTIAESAISSDDWQLVADQWRQVINLLREVPTDSPNRAEAQKKIKEYQRQLIIAKQNVANPPQVEEVVSKISDSQPQSTSQASKASASTSKSQAKPKPKINATREFLNAYFHDVVNEGGYGYEYWCTKKAGFRSRLFSPRSYKILQADNNYGVVRIDSSNKGGSHITSNWSFYLDKETDKKHTGLPSGLCISLMTGDD